MRHFFCAALLALPLQPASDTGDGLVASSLTSPSSNGSAGANGSTGASGSTGSTTSATGLAYTQDIAPLLQSDCVVCHGTSRADGGIRLSTYAQVMTTVRAGSASSLLVTATSSSGSMYRYWSGTSATRAAKAANVRSWVVTYNAQVSR
jgi:hypothetical protein